MGLKHIVIDAVDYIFIVVFVIGQAGLIVFMLNNLFEFIPMDYKIRNAIGLNFGLMTANFFLLFFTKIFLLLERKTA